MSKRASPTAIGAFVVGAVVLIVAGMLAFGSGQFFRHSLKYACSSIPASRGSAAGRPCNFGV